MLGLAPQWELISDLGYTLVTNYCHASVTKPCSRVINLLKNLQWVSNIHIKAAVRL